MTKKRKYMAYLITFGVISVALFTAKLTGGEYVDVTKFILGVFVMGNVGSKFANREQK